MGRKALSVTKKASFLHPKESSLQSVTNNRRHEPVERLMNKLGVDKKKFGKMCWNTVYLYAEFNGIPVGIYGIFSTMRKKISSKNLLKIMARKMGT